MTINNSKNRLQVFLCHSSNDKEIIRELFQKLVDEGFDPWLDEEKLLPGQDWDYEIKKALKASDAVIVFLSNNSVSKAGYVQKEIKWAIDLAQEQPEGEIFLIPARIENCNIPNQLSHLHSPEIFKQKGYLKLVEALRIRSTRLNRFIKDDLLKTYRNFLEEHFNQENSRVLLEKIGTSLARLERGVNIGFVGQTGTGKTSLIYTLAETDFNFLQFQEQSKYSTSISKGGIRFVEYHFDSLLEEGSEPIKNIGDEINLCLFTISATARRLSRDDVFVFKNIVSSGIPVVIVVTQMDRCNEEEGKLLLTHIEQLTSRVAIPVSVVQGVNIDLLRLIIAKSMPGFY